MEVLPTAFRWLDFLLYFPTALDCNLCCKMMASRKFDFNSNGGKSYM